MLEKEWNPKLPVDTLKKSEVDIHETASRFKLWLDKVRNHANQSMNDAFEYDKQKWDQSCTKRLKDSFEGTFIIKALHRINAVQVENSGELENKHPTFPVSLVKHYTSSNKELFPLRNETPLEVSPLYQSEEKKVLKVLKEKRIRVKDERQYLVRYRNPQHEDEWIVAEKIPDAQPFLRRFRHERRLIPQ
ncbi:hypothetical protein O181_057538 [Austropuccinia psidii MF-1]|uniref:Chromo domain-containing protein n=1 Tax=Austropuccinia psidii MF-1 TaxID=1389203 RepID=A0A9Q3HUL1_9BASI|nr:hypothetical protein [Austropuccinia psidii MF-1]